MSARDEVLQRIRQANAQAGAAVPAVERAYHRGGPTADGAALLDLLEERLLDYRAAVHRCAPGREGETVSAVLAGLLAEGERVLHPPGLPDRWCPEAVADDPALTAADLDRFAAVVTGAAAACAETGTIALDASPDQGRRALTLVPDLHVCVVRADQVVRSVPELLARLDPQRPITLVSGPSATSDIELERVEGVHGPRTLVVILVAGDQAAAAR